MSTAANRAATAAKFAPPRPSTSRPAGETVDDPQVPDLVMRKAPPDDDTTRSTVDLGPAEHEATNEWQRDAAFTLGVKSHKVSRDRTIRLALKLVRTDETTGRKLLKLLRDELQGET